MSNENWLNAYARKLDKPLTAMLRGEAPVPPQGNLPALAAQGKSFEVIIKAPAGQQKALGFALDSAGVRPTLDLSVIDGFAAVVTVPQVQQLVTEDCVEMIFHDGQVHTCLDIASPTVGAPKAARLGALGEGTTAAILDTGIFPHPDLAGRIIGWADFTPLFGLSPYDDNGHGTHVAGCVAGNGTMSDGLYRGPAFRANLVGVKVLNAAGFGSFSRIIAGIGFCILYRSLYNISVIN